MNKTLSSKQSSRSGVAQNGGPSTSTSRPKETPQASSVRGNLQRLTNQPHAMPTATQGNRSQHNGGTTRTGMNGRGADLSHESDRESSIEPIDSSRQPLHHQTSSTSITSRSSRTSGANETADTTEDELALGHSSADPQGRKRKRVVGNRDSEADGANGVDEAGAADVEEEERNARVKVVLRENDENGGAVAHRPFTWMDFGRKWPRVVDLFEDIQEVLIDGFTSHQAGEITVAIRRNIDGERDSAEEKKDELKSGTMKSTPDFLPTKHRFILKSTARLSMKNRLSFSLFRQRCSQASRAHVAQTSISSTRQSGCGYQGVKERRGFASLVTGRLLMPAKVPFTPELFDKYSEGMRLSGSEIPRFCYDTTEKTKGKGKNPFFSHLLRLTAVCVLHGKSSVDRRTGSMGMKSKSSKGTKRSKSARCGISSMTIPLLAYICILVYYALTNATSFSPTPNSFPLRAFYYRVIESLGSREKKEFREKLLEQWDEFLWPDTFRENEDDASDFDDIEGGSDDDDSEGSHAEESNDTHAAGRAHSSLAQNGLGAMGGSRGGEELHSDRRSVAPEERVSGNGTGEQ